MPQDPSIVAVLCIQSIVLVIHLSVSLARMWILRDRIRGWTHRISEGFFAAFILMGAVAWCLTFFQICDEYQASKRMSLEELTLYMFRPLHLKIFFCISLSYNIALLLLKGAFLLLYFAISQRLSSSLRYTLYATIAVVVTTFGTHTLYQTFWCQPIHNFWTYDPVTLQPKCTANQVNFKILTIQYWTNCITNIIIMAFPLLLLQRLKLGTKEKFGLAFVFFCGCLSISMSSVNYGIVVRIVLRPIQVGDVRLQQVLYTVEMVTANIAFCLPAFRVLIREHYNERTRTGASGLRSMLKFTHLYGAERVPAIPPREEIFVTRDFEINVASETELCRVEPKLHLRPQDHVTTLTRCEAEGIEFSVEEASVTSTTTRDSCEASGTVPKEEGSY